MSLPLGWTKEDEQEIWTSATGYGIERTFEGPMGIAEVTLNAAIAGLDAGYSEIRVGKKPHSTDGRGLSTIKVVWATDSSGNIRTVGSTDYGLVYRAWTKHTNKHQLSLLSHPTVNTILAIDANWPARIRVAAITYRRLLDAFYADGGTEPDAAAMIVATLAGWAGAGTTAQDIATWLFSEFIADENATWTWDQPVLRKTEVVISASSLAAVHTNVGRIYSYTALGTAEGTLALGTLINAAGLSSWYWLKGSPDVEQSSGGRFQIVQEWEGVPVITPTTTKRYGATIT